MQMETQQLWAPETYEVFVSVANYKRMRLRELLKKYIFSLFLNIIHYRFRIGTDEQVHNSERED